jgi:hypothetical protein
VRIAAVAPELLFGSKVEELLKQAGHDVVRHQRADQVGEADVVVAVLDGVEPEAVATDGPPVLGIYAHTRPDIRDRALAAGFVLCVPRSRFVREAGELIYAVLAASRSPEGFSPGST